MYHWLTCHGDIVALYIITSRYLVILTEILFFSPLVSRSTQLSPIGPPLLMETIQSSPVGKKPKLTLLLPQ